METAFCLGFFAGCCAATFVYWLLTRRIREPDQVAELAPWRLMLLWCLGISAVLSSLLQAWARR